MFSHVKLMIMINTATVSKSEISVMGPCSHKNIQTRVPNTFCAIQAARLWIAREAGNYELVLIHRPSDRGSIRGRGKRILPLAFVSGAQPASCPAGTGDTFHGGKTQPGFDADHSLPSSSEVMNE
jgi:hypothetical protein